MTSGLIVLVVVLAAASAVGAGMRMRAGRFTARGSRTLKSRTGSADSSGPAVSASVLTAADLGEPLGERATLVQFSTEFCAYCGPARELLTEVAGDLDGVAFVEVDAAQRMDLTRRLRVLATPTILVLGADGVIERRSSGRPRKSELLAAVGAVVDGSGSR